MRLPPTSISLSQSDVNQALGQLEIYEGLLKQGFKREEIAAYFHQQNQDQESSRCLSLLPEPTPAPSTVEIYRKASEKLDMTNPQSRELKSTSTSSTETDLICCSSEDGSERVCSDHISVSTHAEPDLSALNQSLRPHVPRQSSLLRFASVISSDSPSSQRTQTQIPMSPRPNISYRPRSETYSYDQSAIDEDEFQETSTRSFTQVYKSLEELSLDDELILETDLVTNAAPFVRPHIDTITPSRALSIQDNGLLNLLDTMSNEDDVEASFPSSPPEVLPYVVDPDEQSLNHRENIVKQYHHLSPQYFDGSFTVYDDSLPATVQPQTPADLDRHQRWNMRDAAYTAPPGMVRSMTTPSSSRNFSGDQSPTVRSILVRERRRREFIRSVRIEGLRLERARDRDRPVEDIGNNFWRDDLDADGVGDENFDTEVLADEPDIRMRVVSGNRRFVQDV